MLNKFFGSSKKAAPGPPPPTLQEAQKSLEGRATSLVDKIRHLDKELSGYKQQMSKMRPGAAKEGVKRKALLVLKRKKAYESQRDQLASQSFNLDQAAFASSSMADTASTVAAMKAASGALKTQLAAVRVEDVYDMTDDMQELLDQNNEIQEALSRTYETPEGFDDDALEQELNALEDYISEEEGPPAWLSDMPSAAPPSSLPAGGHQQPASPVPLNI